MIMMIAFFLFHFYFIFFLEKKINNYLRQRPLLIALPHVLYVCGSGGGGSLPARFGLHLLRGTVTFFSV